MIYRAYSSTGEFSAEVELDADGTIVRLDTPHAAVRHDVEELQRERGWTGQQIVDKYLGAGYARVEEVDG